MTDYKMTDEKRKMLTEKLLGGCWHEWVAKGVYTECSKCGEINLTETENRTFTTINDRQAVFEKIRDVGEWTKFYRYAGKHWLQDEEAWKRDEPLEVWLFLDNPERACCLAAMFLEEQE